MLKRLNCTVLMMTLCLSLLSTQYCSATPSAVLPADMPFWSNADISININLINTIAAKYDAKYGASGSAQDFFLRYLLLASVDDLSTLPLNKQTANAYLGNFYIAGFFGGMILRDAVFIYGGGSKDGFLGVLMQAMPGVLQAVMNLGTDKFIFNAVAKMSGTAVDKSLTGSNSAVLSSTKASVDELLAIYGIDSGLYAYFQSIAPAGAPAADNGLVCNSFIGCTMQGAPVQTLIRYNAALAKLNNPECSKFWSISAVRWCEMTASTNTIGKGAAALVGGLFKKVMGPIDVPASDYVPLVELTATSVIVAESALLPTMQGYAESDVTAARKGLLLKAGKVMWLGSFMLGMSSDLPTGTFPELH